MAQPEKLPSYSSYTKILSSDALDYTGHERLQKIVPDAPEGLEIREIEPKKSQDRKTFALFYQQVPLVNGQILMRRSADQKALMFQVPNLNFKTLGLENKPSDKNFKTKKWISNGIKWFLVNEITNLSGEEPTAEKIWANEEGNLLFYEDWLLRNRMEDPDSNVICAVFKPDPVSKLQIPYGGFLRDKSDSNSILLQKALDTLEMRVHFEDDTFSLKNNRFQMGEFSDPIRPHARFISPDSFCFPRNHACFEEVNVFYHLNTFRKFVDALGFDALANYPLKVDAHGMNGADQSAYSPLQDMLAFGEGNVDDGEDAGVIIHEYGHALCQSANPFGNSGFERRSLEEGICDYLAGSYVRTQSEFEWNRLFKWDGHNEFWPGRTLNTAKMYPDNLVGQIHKDGEIFSYVLTTMETTLGREATHKILLSSLPFLLPNFTMPQAAQTLIDTDSSLNNGVNSALIRQLFLAKGIQPGMIIVSTKTELAMGEWSVFSSHFGKNWILRKPEKNQGLVFLTDQNGRVLRNYVFESGKSRLEISSEGLRAGMYFLRIQSESAYKTLKIIVLN